MVFDLSPTGNPRLEQVAAFPERGGSLDLFIQFIDIVDSDAARIDNFKIPPFFL